MHVFFENSLKLLLSPVLIYQGLRVRKHALILPEPVGPRSGITNSGPPLRLLILGDSSAAGVGVDHQSDALSGQLTQRLDQSFALDWDLVAQTGATTSSTLNTANELSPKTYDAAVVALGVNDVTRSIPLQKWLKQQSDLTELLTDKFGVQRIYTSGLPPMDKFPVLPQPLRWLIGKTASRFDRAINVKRLANPAIHQLDLNLPLDPALMASDGFHPSDKLYAIWADELANAIHADFASKPKNIHP